MEMAKQRLVVDEVHFLSKNKKTMIVMPYEILYLLIKSKNDYDILERNHNSFNLQKKNLEI